MALCVVPLHPAHDVAGFNCSSDPLNSWLQKIAGQHQEKLLSRTYILEDEASPGQVIGFYGLAIRGLVQHDQLPAALVKRLPANLPAYTLGRLAIEARYQGQGVGELLLVDAVERVGQLATQAGGPFLFVDAKDEAAARFYAKYGFVAMPDAPFILALRL